jgi:hypothetical protein
VTAARTGQHFAQFAHSDLAWLAGPARDSVSLAFVTLLVLALIVVALCEPVLS